MSDHFLSLRAFNASAEAGSFAGAGRAMSLSRDQVSKLVSALECRLGVRLFERSTRAVTLTEVGANYLERVRRALSDLDAAEAATRAADIRPFGLLSVHAPLSWGVTVLEPLCTGFRAAFPAVRIELILDDASLDPIPADTDIVIRIASRFEGSAAVERLGTVGRGLYAAPSYLERRPAPQVPEDLVCHACVQYAHLASGARWLLESGEEVRQIHVEGGFASNAGIAVLGSIIAGTGIGILPDFLAAGPLARGEIERVLPAWRPPLLHVHALTHPAMRHAPKIRAYIDFLKDHVGVADRPSPPVASVE